MTARPTWSPSAQDRLDVEAWSADLIGLDEYPDATPMDIAKANLRRNTVAFVLAENTRLTRENRKLLNLVDIVNEFHTDDFNLTDWIQSLVKAADAYAKLAKVKS